jgi:hypothetical protein
MSSSVSLPVVLTLLFLVLKLTGTIGWSWLWVLSPLWISATLGGAIVIFGFLVGLVASA